MVGKFFFDYKFFAVRLVGEFTPRNSDAFARSLCNRFFRLHIDELIL